jgi:hypothetical protein
MSSINTFSTPPACDGTAVLSTINKPILQGIIPTDATGRINKVELYYKHEDNSKKRVTHTGANLTGQACWSPGDKTGVWELTGILTYISTRVYSIKRSEYVDSINSDVTLA